MSNTLDTSAALYGRGVFTTVAIVDRQPFLWNRHWARLSENASRLRLDISEFSKDQTLSDLTEAILSKEISYGRARVTLFDESRSPIWADESTPKTTLSILVAERRQIPDGMRLVALPYRLNSKSILTGVKACSYLENLLSWELARWHGFDEGLRLNERGEIASACMANVFWEREGKLYTPSLPTGCLPGTTREYILENVECEEVEKGIEELERADRIFLTSAGLGVATIGEFNGRKLDTSNHPLSSLLPF